MKVSSLFNPTYGIMRSIVAIMLGLAMLIWPGVAVNLFVRILGAALILIGGISLAINYLGKENMGSLFAFLGFTAFIFGIILLALPEFFVNLLAYLFGAMMIIFSIGQIVTLIYSNKFARVNFTYYIAPVIVFAGGIVMFCKPFETVETMFMIFGGGLIIYAVTEFLVALHFGKLFKEYKAAEGHELVKAEAVDAEVVDSKPLD